MVGKQVALCHVAAALGEELPRFGRGGSFGDHAEAEPVSEVDGRSHDGEVRGVGGELEYEGAVDLELVELKALEVGE